MTINDKRKPDTVTFGSLKVGECFVDQADGSYCMVIDNYFNENYNAVDLEDGRLYWFENDQEVVKVNARLEVF